jgi:hypothetical protein
MRARLDHTCDRRDRTRAAERVAHADPGPTPCARVVRYARGVAPARIERLFALARRRLAIDDRTYRALLPGARYRAYHAENVDELLSIEPA